MADDTLDRMIDGWLDGSLRPFCLRFPGLLEARFESDTGRARCRKMMLFGLVGFSFATALYPTVCDVLPDVAGRARSFFLLGAMPFGFLIVFGLRLHPPPLLREGMSLLANMGCVFVVTYLYAMGENDARAFLVAAVCLMMIHNTIGMQLRFRFAAAAVCIAILAYAVALLVRPEIDALARRSLLSIGCLTAAYLLLANWRLEREERRGYLATLRETLQLEAVSQRNVELDALARRDPLTGLANRRAYDSWLATSWEQASACRGRLGLIMMDVDRFKAFNDFYGHAAGDQCLQTIALCLREQLRGTSDLVARLGGEEFAVLLPGLEDELCADIAERLRRAIRHLELPHAGIGRHGLVSISAGVASQIVRPGSSEAALFEAADAALYEAKVSGRNRICVASLREADSQAAAE